MSRGRAEMLRFNTRTQADRILERTGALLEHSELYERLGAEDSLEFCWRLRPPSWLFRSAKRRGRIAQFRRLGSAV